LGYIPWTLYAPAQNATAAQQQSRLLFFCLVSLLSVCHVASKVFVDQRILLSEQNFLNGGGNVCALAQTGAFLAFRFFLVSLRFFFVVQE
jgi:hydrogenase-4 membrane subunit HyfE